jgi:thioredoxin reductase (NADPH)
MYDVIIIGKGPAGISAALYTVRAGLKTLVIAKDRGALEKADRIENYFGVAGAISGRELLDNGEAQARRLGVNFSEDEAVSINGYENIEVTGLKESYKGICLILAPGKSRKKLSIKGMDVFEGKGLSYCTTCDGFFYRGKKTAIIGYNEYLAHEASELMAFTGDITIITNGRPLQLGKFEESLGNLKVCNKGISAIYGDDALKGVIYEDGEKEEFDGVFMAYESPGASDLAYKSGILTSEGSIVTDREQKTNIPGIFAAGDCTGGFLQVSTAVGEGAAAAKSAIEFVRELKKAVK